MTTIPLWAAILMALAGPLVALVGIVLAQFHVAAKVESVKVEINHKMDELLRLTRTSSLAEGEKIGFDRATAEFQAVAERAIADAAQRAQGASDLLVAQQVPPSAQHTLAAENQP